MRQRRHALAERHRGREGLAVAHYERVQDDLAHFVEGSASAYVGFGSMPDRAPEATRALVAAAGKLADVRIVMHAPDLARAHASAGTSRENDGVLVVESAAHGALFPKMRAIVHHAGAGTTATASRVSVPQVVVPHFVDQPLWSERLRRRGVCGGVLPRTRPNAPSLTKALRRCVEDVRLHESAHTLRDELARTDPIAAAVHVVESMRPLR